MICILTSKFQISPEDGPQRVKTCSWLTYYFHKIVFLITVNLPLFILQHNGMHKVKIIVLRNVTPYNLVDGYQCCGDMCCLHLQDG